MWVPTPGEEAVMARVPPVIEAEAAPAARELLARQRAEHGRVTNMKRTLAHVPAALEAFMRWYDLHAEAVSFLGPRAAMLFAHAISAQTDCLICSTFFRRWLAEAGDDPDDLRLDEREQALVEYGRQLARDANGVPDELFARLRRSFDDRQLVALTALAGLMIATNVFNNALKVDLDEYLLPFRKGAPR
jgi:alkylhydroperoxidase family enzyme